ncbi:hypothetical protein Csa_007765 [Cucumis sativus]|uniref:Potassium transporter n=1 Tax=Cucumis sativus TaxID=3659 RepID=A0A0A0KQC7_CUCSA|nr:hypothetical protein Csa_007765 [Cucumis sativus]
MGVYVTVYVTFANSFEASYRLVWDDENNNITQSVFPPLALLNSASSFNSFEGEYHFWPLYWFTFPLATTDPWKIQFPVLFDFLGWELELVC